MWKRLKRLLGKGPQAIIWAVFVRLEAPFVRVRQRIFSPAISRRQFLSKAGLSQDTDEALSQLRDWSGRCTPPSVDAGRLVSEWPDVVAAEAARTVAAADEVCEHVFSLLGSGPTPLGTPINWHQDFISGKTWPKVATARLALVDLNDDSDIKVPWELSRFQHLVTLGKAYALTREEKYPREFVTQLEDWWAENEVGIGVNWACTMDVAIRAVNWIWAYGFFSASREIRPEFRLRFFHSLYVHGRFIRANLEWAPVRHNHYLSDIVGLAYLGVLFKETREGAKWLDLAGGELEREIRHQVYPDGADHEGSIPYHRLAVELFASAPLLLRRNGIEMSTEFMGRLERMFEFIQAYSKPDGRAPLFGDSDDGRLHILSEETRNEINDHRYLLAVGAVLFERADFKRSAGKFWEEAWWLVGEEGRESFSRLSDGKRLIGSADFTESGFYFMRRDDLYLAVDCGPVGLRGGGGHGHNDALSVEICAYDRTVITDSGTFAYSANPETRNEFRSTRAHNVVVVDDREMAELGRGYDLWTIADQARARCLEWRSGEDTDIFVGEHYGYDRGRSAVVHQRLIHFDKSNRFWIIKDYVYGEGSHKIELRWHFAEPEVELEVRELIVRTSHSEGNLALVPLNTERISATILDSWYSPSYGKRRRSKVAVYAQAGPVPLVFTTLIAPVAEGMDRLAHLKSLAIEIDAGLERRE